MNVMLLAAGEGTRLRPYTNTLPKPAIPFLNVPLAAHALHFLDSIEISKLVVNTFHLPQKIHELFHSLPVPPKNLFFSDERSEILGSGGGLGFAREHFVGGGDFIMMNADEVILPQDSQILKKAVEQHKKSQALATLLVMDHPGVGKQFGGVWTRPDQTVMGFGKTPSEEATKGWHFVGVQILSEKIFDYIAPTGASNILYDAVTAGIQKGERVQVCPFTGDWFETGNLKDLLEATQKCLRFLSADDPCFQREILMGALSKYSQGPYRVQKHNDSLCLIADSAQVDAEAALEGFVVVGEQCEVGAHSRLRNVILGKDLKLAPHTVAENTLFL